VDIRTFEVTLDDGRLLQVFAAGPDDGTLVIAHHGTPSAGGIFAPQAQAAAARGLRLAGYTRPGYGASSRHEGRSVADCAADVAAVADHLEADRFFTTGASGGGPHALACAALLADRVLACATIAGVAPYDSEGLDFLEGMAEENHVEFGAALEGPDALGACLETWVADLASVTGPAVAESLGDLVSAPDVAVLTGDYADFLAEAVRRGVSTGIGGWFDDDMAFTRPWGFALDDIRVPVRVWQGAQDHMVPESHGRWLAAHIPGAKAELRPEHGHLSLDVAAAGDIFDALLQDGAAGSGGSSR
jgi:pimeloyl-ACP methyl ester carboxylesterase